MNAQASAIRVHDISRSFGMLRAVDHLSLVIPKAAVFGFLGPNGSGKSTTMRMLLGLIAPSSGDIEVLGLHIPREAEALKRRIGYMTQRFSLYEDLSVAENLQFLASIHDLQHRVAQRRIDEVLSTYRLQSRKQQLAGTLSGGERQRLALAGAVLHQPELLVLDEPTSQVDPESRREFWEHIFELSDAGATVLISTHFMDEAERCHQLAILDRGRLVAQGSPRELIRALPFQVVLVEAENVREARTILAQQPDLGGLAQIGNALRVLWARDVAFSTIVDVVQKIIPTAVCVQVQANLEDVFVAATRSLDRVSA